MGIDKNLPLSARMEAAVRELLDDIGQGANAAYGPSASSEEAYCEAAETALLNLLSEYQARLGDLEADEEEEEEEDIFDEFEDFDEDEDLDDDIDDEEEDDDFGDDEDDDEEDDNFEDDGQIF